jgi:hypothetical protein
MHDLHTKVSLRNDSALANNLAAVADRLNRNLEYTAQRDYAAERARELAERREWERRNAAACHKRVLWGSNFPEARWEAAMPECRSPWSSAKDAALHKGRTGVSPIITRHADSRGSYPVGKGRRRADQTEEAGIEQPTPLPHKPPPEAEGTAGFVTLGYSPQWRGLDWTTPEDPPPGAAAAAACKAAHPRAFVRYPAGGPVQKTCVKVGNTFQNQPVEAYIQDPTGTTAAASTPPKAAAKPAFTNSLMTRPARRAIP